MERGNPSRKPSRLLVAVSHRIYPTVEGVRSVNQLFGITNETIRKLKADLVGDRFVRKLEKEGKFS